MKNLLLTTLLFFLILSQVNAQYIALYEEPEMKISQDAMSWENQKLRSDLTLTDAQFEKVKGITLERTKARSIVAKLFKYEPGKLDKKLREIDSQFDNEFAAVLNAKQFKKYLILQNRKADKEKEAEHAVAQPEGDNFNARIQEMISKATAPAINNSLKPKQDTTSQEMVLTTQDSLENKLAGNHNELLVTPNPAAGKDISAPVKSNEQKQAITASEKEDISNTTNSSENKESIINQSESHNSEANTDNPDVETNEPGE